jgi:hypothetical protein
VDVYGATRSAPVRREMIDDLAAVKSLVQKLGAEQMRKIVGLFERLFSSTSGWILRFNCVLLSMKDDRLFVI